MPASQKLIEAKDISWVITWIMIFALDLFFFPGTTVKTATYSLMISGGLTFTLKYLPFFQRNYNALGLLHVFTLSFVSIAILWYPKGLHHGLSILLVSVLTTDLLAYWLTPSHKHNNLLITWFFLLITWHSIRIVVLPNLDYPSIIKISPVLQHLFSFIIFLGTIAQLTWGTIIVRNSVLMAKNEKIAIQESNWIKNFFAIVNHELRSPIANSQLQLEILETRLRDSMTTEIAQNLSTIKESQESVLYTTNTFLLGYKLANQNSDNCIINAINEMRSKFGQTALERPSKCTCTPTEVMSIAIALQVLVDNALKYGADDVKVNLVDQATIVVEDNGSGISKDLIENLGKDAVSSAKKGTGMGIWLLHRLLNEVGWSMKFESAINTGTQVYLRKTLA